MKSNKPSNAKKNYKGIVQRALEDAAPVELSVLAIRGLKAYVEMQKSIRMTELKQALRRIINCQSNSNDLSKAIELASELLEKEK